MTNPGIILHAERDGTHYLRLVGEVRYPLAPSLDHFLQNLFATTTPRAFFVDLSATEAIDSTNLGLLVKISRFMGERCVVLFSPRDDITEVLISMGFDQFFQLITTNDASDENALTCTPISISEANPSELGRTMLEAHRALMTMDARNEAAFKDIVRYLEQETHA